MTTVTTPAAVPDLAAVKRRQQETWASGDFAVIGATIVSVAELLCDATDVRAGTRVMDVATGSGNAAIAAARMGCGVTGVDYVPALLERGRERAAAERLAIDFVDGDAEDLPARDGSFDAVLSVYGTMFAPDHMRAASETARVCRPGGRIGLASWTPEGFIGDMFRAIVGHLPPPPGVASPLLWGTEAHLAEIFGDTVEWVAHTRRMFTFRFTSPEEFVDVFATYYGPMFKAFEALDEARRRMLASELADLARRHDRLHERGAIAIPAEYLESVGVRR